MGHLWSTTEICCTCYHGGSNLLVFLVWIIMPLGFFMKALCVCVCGSKIDRLEMISSPWWSVNFRVPRFETRPCVKNPWWKKTGWDEEPSTWNMKFLSILAETSTDKTRISNHQHWNRKIWFLFIGVVVVIIWIYPQPRMPVTFSSIMNHFSGSGIFNLNLHLWLAS